MLNISNVQHFSVGDGEGIRTTVFFKGCHLVCPWCHNPENLSASPTTLCYPTTGKSDTRGGLVTVEALVEELLEDQAFYDESGGGVTLSGGEVMLQAEAVVPLVKRLRECKVHVLIDTAGCVPYERFSALNPYVAGYLFDFKTANGERYRRIGGDLLLVKKNIRRLREDGMRVVIRIPLIPDFNTSREETEGICRALCDMGIREVELLPFHRMGSAKYEAMGLDYAYRDVEPLRGAALEAIRSVYQTYFLVKLEG